MKKDYCACSMCRGSGFVLSYDCGISGCEEYKDCPKCLGAGGFNGGNWSLDETAILKTPITKEKNKRRKIIL